VGILVIISAVLWKSQCKDQAVAAQIDHETGMIVRALAVDVLAHPHPCSVGGVPLVNAHIAGKRGIFSSMVCAAFVGVSCNRHDVSFVVQRNRVARGPYIIILRNLAVLVLKVRTALHPVAGDAAVIVDAHIAIFLVDIHREHGPAFVQCLAPRAGVVVSRAGYDAAKRVLNSRALRGRRPVGRGGRRGRVGRRVRRWRRWRRW